MGRHRSPASLYSASMNDDAIDRGELKVGIVGATGYGGGELIRILSRHPSVRIVALQARDRDDEPLAVSHPHLSRTGARVAADLPDEVDAVFLALPHGPAAKIVPGLIDRGVAVIDLGPDFRLRDP